MSEEQPTPRAGTYFEIRLQRERVSRLRMNGRRARALLLGFLEPTWLLGIEPKLRTTVDVVRRSDGSVLIDFEHSLESDALDHARSLEARLETMSIADFARDLGIGSSLF